MLPCLIVRGQCRAKVATPGVERTNAKHEITSLILNSHAGKNLTLKFQGTLRYELSILVSGDKPLVFAGTEEKFETFLSARAENH